MGKTELEKPQLNVVLRGDESVVALSVDAVDDVLELDEETFGPPPDTLASHLQQVIKGVYKLQNRLLLVLDADQAVNAEELGDPLGRRS